MCQEPTAHHHFRLVLSRALFVHQPVPTTLSLQQCFWVRLHDLVVAQVVYFSVNDQSRLVIVQARLHMAQIFVFCPPRLFLPATTMSNSGQRRSSRTHRPTKRARGDVSSSDEEPTPTPEVSPAPSSPPPETRSRPSRRSQTPKERFNERYKTSTNSAQQVLDLQHKQWTSAVYDHFLMPPDIDAEGDEIKYVFKCKKHPQTTLSRVRHDDSTSNLNRHIERCAHVDTPESQAMEKFASGSTYTEVMHRIQIALWIARRRRPYIIAEDQELLDIFRSLNASCITPSRTTISKDVQEIHDITKSVVMEILAIANCLEEFKIEKKVGAFTGDNAANNGTLVKELSVILPSFGGEKTTVRCFAHTLNLVAKAILSPFAAKSTSRKPNKDSTSNDEDSDDELERELLALDADDDGTVGDEDLCEEDDLVDDMDDDEVAPGVQAQDAAVIDDIAAEADLNKRLPRLPRSCYRNH
ncbi:hypothetical protein D9619_012911 [Psilocybe cf. subviscida]|uniref:Uncharacterized protein n=1 Tax=Psilocybe cf. subviscida TaxID=2480587 RepID=A0A8H5BHX9_9AGAR|nr:hypothetical protein D9619_012911 [Psilocybe cf. subviscida]